MERNEIKLLCVLEPCVSCCCLSLFARSLERSWSCAKRSAASLLLSPCPHLLLPTPPPSVPSCPFSLALLYRILSSFLSFPLPVSLAFSLPFSSLFFSFTLFLFLSTIFFPLSLHLSLFISHYYLPLKTVARAYTPVQWQLAPPGCSPTLHLRATGCRTPQEAR